MSSDILLGVFTNLSLKIFVAVGVSLIQSMWLNNRQLEAGKLRCGYVEVGLATESSKLALHLYPHFLEVITKVCREWFHRNTLPPGTKHSR